MNRDEELYALCKEAYEKLNWQIEDNQWILSDENGELFVDSTPAFLEGFKTIAPLYTSDYLLEKLPPFVNIRKTRVFSHEGNGIVYTAINEEDDEFENESDTPLKALLKLTIALADAGELK